MAFDPEKHLMQLKNSKGSSDYLEVKWRLVWFRELCPEGTIDTEEILVDLDRPCEAEVFVWNNEKRKSEKVLKQGKGVARFKATVTDGHGGRATATGSECQADFGDYIEKAETKAIGRALAMLGYGTQFTGEELAERHRIVDSPVSRQDEQQPDPGSDTEEGISEQQKSSIRKLCEHLGKPEPDMLNALDFLGARKKIQQLTAEYKEYLSQQRQAKQAQPVQQSSNEFDKLRAEWAEVYHIADQQVMERWPKYLMHLLGAIIADPDLTPGEIGRINGDIEGQRRKAKVPAQLHKQAS